MFRKIKYWFRKWWCYPKKPKEPYGMVILWCRHLDQTDNPEVGDGICQTTGCFCRPDGRNETPCSAGVGGLRAYERS